MCDFEEPDYPCCAETGEIVVVTETVCIRNDVGGTTILEGEDSWRIEVIKSFWDYECGWRFHGRLLDDKQVESARQQGTTGYGPKDYERNPEHAAEVAEAQENFDPSYCYFSEFNIA